MNGETIFLTILMVVLVTNIIIEAYLSYLRRKTKKRDWWSKILEQKEKHQLDTIKVLDEVNRLESEGKIYSCFKKANSRTCKFRVRTILGRFAHSYIDVLKKTKSNPDMTLKEYSEIIK